MSKNLVIVESPAKAKTIEGFLGKDFLVKSSYGHVMDLNKAQMGIDIENGFEPQYEVSPDKKKLVPNLKKLQKKPKWFGLLLMKTAKEKLFPGTFSKHLV
jgi:DNA topoisomerase I